MKLTALEIKKHEFGRAFRGYDPEEVDAFLNVVAQHWQSLNEDMRRLEERLEEQGQRVTHYQKVEEALEHALENARVVAQKRLDEAERQAARVVEAADAASRKTLGDAQEESDRMLADAEQRSQSLVENAERRLIDLSSEVDLARMGAIRDLDALSKDRSRVLTGFREFLISELDALERYDAQRVTSIDAFSADEDQSGADAGMVQSQAAGALAGEAEDTGEPEAARDASAEAAPDASAEATPDDRAEAALDAGAEAATDARAEAALDARAEAALDAGAEAATDPASPPRDEDAETSSTMEEQGAPSEPPADDIQTPQENSGRLQGATLAGGFAFELEMDAHEASPDAPREEIAESGPATDMDMSAGRLPTADESFESDSVAGESDRFELRKTRHPESAQDQATESEEPFGAEEEIRKIRRILEDLDD